MIFHRQMNCLKEMNMTAKIRSLLVMVLISASLSSLPAQDGIQPQADSKAPDAAPQTRNEASDNRPADPNTTPPLDKSGLVGCDVHALGIYAHEASGDDRVYVTIKNTGRPMVVVLCSYMETQWHVTLEHGADVRQLIASGWFSQEIVAPKEIPVHILAGSDAKNEGYFWAYSWHTKEGRTVRKRVRELTDLEITTFQGIYNGSRHIIDGKSGLVSELDKERSADEETTAKDLPDSFSGLSEAAAAYHTQMFGAKAKGNIEEAEQYKDLLAYAMLSIRLQKKELTETLEASQKVYEELKASGMADDSQQLINLSNKISRLKELLALPEKYSEFLPKRSETKQDSSTVENSLSLISFNEGIADLQKRKGEADLKWRAAEALTLEQAKRLRKEASEGSARDMQKLKEQLTPMVRQSFERQMELQEARMQLAAAELAALKEKQASRKTSADLIIQRRVEDLLTDADLSWPQVRAAGGAANAKKTGSGSSSKTTTSSEVQFNTAEELVAAMQQLSENQDPGAFLPLLSDNAVEELAGVMLLTTSMFASVAPVIAAQPQADAGDSETMMDLVAILGRSMNNDASADAKAAYQRLSARTNVMMAALRKGPAYPNIDEFESDLRKSVGILRDPREFLIDVLDSMRNMPNSGNGNLLGNLQNGKNTSFTLAYADDGNSASATPVGVNSDSVSAVTLQLGKSKNGWRVQSILDRNMLAQLALGPQVQESSSKTVDALRDME